MKIKLIITILLFSLGSLKLFSQEILKTLSEKQVIELVKKFHPVAKQAEINIEKAKADITVAKGLVDP
jgi:uncharacterized protein YpmS